MRIERIFFGEGVGRECEFYELGEFYEFFKLGCGLRILGEFSEWWEGNAN